MELNLWSLTYEDRPENEVKPKTDEQLLMT
jgi:hypothetical protein